MTVQDMKGDWALVTGASSGIGAEFCRQLAAQGIHLVMAARRQDLLDTLAAELVERHQIRTLVVPIDLGQVGSAAVLKAATTAAGIRIRLLINNAAFGPWGSFDKTSAVVYEQIVQLVVATPVALCRLYLDELRSFDSAGIINLSSPAALQPVSYKAVYSAAKAGLHSFSIALYGEMQGTGVMVQTLLPGPTATELDAKGGAYHSALGEDRKPPGGVVTLSLSSLAQDLPFVTTNPGTYKQRAFNGLAPIKMIVREVKKMFAAPPGR